MMIISPTAIIKELKELDLLNNKGCDMQKANLCVLLASYFMDKACNSIYSPEYIDNVSAEQLKIYSKIYGSIKTISNQLQDLSKTSTRYVQDL